MPLASFPPALLGDDEDVVLDLRPHWLSLVRPVAQTLALAVAVILVMLYAPYSWGSWFFALILAAAALAFLVWPARPLAAWVSSHFVVTTDRVIRRSGLIAKQTMEISFERMTDIRTRQGMLERLVGAGDLIIESAGSLGPVTFEDVRDPEKVQKVIFERKEANDSRRMARSQPWAGHPGPVSLADELRKLHELRELGVVSDEEFQELKASVLQRARSRQAAQGTDP